MGGTNRNGCLTCDCIPLPKNVESWEKCKSLALQWVSSDIYMEPVVIRFNGHWASLVVGENTTTLAICFQSFEHYISLGTFLFSNLNGIVRWCASHFMLSMDRFAYGPAASSLFLKNVAVQARRLTDIIRSFAFLWMETIMRFWEKIKVRSGHNPGFLKSSFWFE